MIDKIAPQILDSAKQLQEGRGATNAPDGTFNFTEGWFRNSGLYDCDLQPSYQLRLMEDFVADKCNWNNSKVKSESAKYKSWQESLTFCRIAYRMQKKGGDFVGEDWKKEFAYRYRDGKIDSEKITNELNNFVLNFNLALNDAGVDYTVTCSDNKIILPDREIIVDLDKEKKSLIFRMSYNNISRTVTVTFEEGYYVALSTRETHDNNKYPEICEELIDYVFWKLLMS